jgi:hypothetical protein
MNERMAKKIYIGLDFSSPYFYGGKTVNANDFDKLAQAADLIKGLLDTMIYLEDARQDRQISITILYSFEAVLEKALLLLWEINKAEDGWDKAEM